VDSGLYLADTNVLLRLVRRDNPEYETVRRTVENLDSRGIRLGYTLQNISEFWNASTRPIERNGFGLSVEETEAEVRFIERSFVLLDDNEAVYREWRRIVLQYRIDGIQVHDARLAAAMYAHGLSTIVTFNVSDSDASKN
jgi:predicted nucleic acid-binding protein